MITPAITNFTLLLNGLAAAFSLHSFIIPRGIIFMAKYIPAGTIIRSSKYQRIGIKSGIKSIGLIAYPITAAINAFAYQGTLGSL